MCVYMCVCHVCVGAHRDQKSLKPMELELQAVVRHQKFCIYDCLACISVCASWACLAPRGHWIPLNWSNRQAMSQDVSAGSQTPVLYKSSEFS